MPNGSRVHSTCTSGSSALALKRGRTERPFNQGFLALGPPIAGCGSLDRKAEDGLSTMKGNFRLSAQKGEPASKTSARSGGAPRHSRFQLAVPASVSCRPFSSAVQARPPAMGPGWGTPFHEIPVPRKDRRGSHDERRQQFTREQWGEQRDECTVQPREASRLEVQRRWLRWSLYNDDQLLSAIVASPSPRPPR
jgi:hypothetical protein